MAWIKVEVQQSDTYTVPYGMRIRVPCTYRIFCKQCGHDDYRKHWEDTQWRAQEMYRDHIPYSPDKTLSCFDWNPDQGDAFRSGPSD